jgi:hypothetical protein
LVEATTAFPNKMLSMAATGDVPGSVVDFGVFILDRAHEPTGLFVRECYSVYLNYVKAMLVLMLAIIVIAGSKGIGKTFFGVFLAFELLKDGEIVLYDGGVGDQGKIRQWLFVPKNVDSAKLQMFNEFLVARHVAQVEAGKVYLLADALEPSMPSRPLFVILCASTALVRILDLGNDDRSMAPVETDPGTRLVVISSPNAAKLKRPFEVGNARALFLPPWNEDEIGKAMTKGVFEPVFVRLELQDVEQRGQFIDVEVPDRVSLVGGNVRAIFANDHPRHVAMELLSNIDADKLAQAFKQRSFSRVDALSKELGLLVQFKPKGQTTSQEAQIGYVSIPTTKMRDLILDAYAQRSLEDNHRLYNAVKNVPAFSSFRAYFLEMRAHELLLQSRAMKARSLTSTGFGTEFELHWPPREDQTFKLMNMSDLDEVGDGQYVRPMIPNFPSIDSFAVVPEALFNAKSRKGMCLVMFQVTVSAEHKIRLKHLVDVHDRVCYLRDIPHKPGSKDIAPSLPVYLCFVSDAHYIGAAQPYFKDEGDEKYVQVPKFGQAIHQFSFTLGKPFTEDCHAWTTSASVEPWEQRG